MRDLIGVWEMWQDLFLDFKVKHLDFWNFDHRPMLLEFQGEFLRYHGSKRFHFELCKELVDNAWKGVDESNAIWGIINRLSACSRVLGNWNKENREAMQLGIKKKQKELADIGNAPGQVDWRRLRDIERDLDGLLECEEVFWRQRSRVSWLREGDRNTKFFHAKAFSRKKRNTLYGLFDESGIWRVGDQMDGVILGYFTDIFKSLNPSSHDIGKVVSTVDARLTVNLRDFLDLPFTEVELKETLFQMNPSKAPGKDGFPAGFYQKVWNVVGKDVT